jgi:hypothetical protein
MPHHVTPGLVWWVLLPILWALGGLAVASRFTGGLGAMTNLSDTFPWVGRMYDAFGPDRWMWGTGFPGATRGQAGRPSLTDELDLIRKEIPFFTAEDREKILGRNAAKLWRFASVGITQSVSSENTRTRSIC